MRTPEALVTDGDHLVRLSDPVDVIQASGAAALEALDRLDGGLWAGFIAYDLGRAIERMPTLNEPTGLPDLLLARFATREPIDKPAPRTFEPLNGWTASIGRAAWCDRIATIHDHLVAGDCYQVNLTRQLVADGAPDPLSLFAALCADNPAPHAAYVSIGDIAVVSASPERFLRRDGRSIETRPIKGTAGDARTLEASAKDHAENVMIVDLARNDLGRLCEYGSVDVPHLFEIEEHPGLAHMVSTVRGTLREDVTPGDIIRATFPPASVTGCPKPRVLEIIEQLEAVRRGVYCGAVGFIDADNDVIDLNVAIRTFTIANGQTSFGVGSGIVADSEAASEWDETELKAHRLMAIASGQFVRSSG